MTERRSYSSPQRPSPGPKIEVALLHPKTFFSRDLIGLIPLKKSVFIFKLLNCNFNFWKTVKFLAGGSNKMSWGTHAWTGKFLLNHSQEEALMKGSLPLVLWRRNFHLIMKKQTAVNIFNFYHLHGLDQCSSGAKMIWKSLQIVSIHTMLKLERRYDYDFNTKLFIHFWFQQYN